MFYSVVMGCVCFDSKYVKTKNDIAMLKMTIFGLAVV